MISSGTKRGLAAVAISALAVTGIPGIANAASLASLGTPGTADLQSVTDNGAVSVRTDGTNTTVSLVATAGAGVEFIQFSVAPSAGGPAVNVGPAVARSADGAFHYEWTPDVNLLNTDVDITATPALSDGSAAPGGTVDTADDVLVSGSRPAVEIASPSALGYFVQPGATPTTPAGVAGYFGQDGHIAGVNGTVSNPDVGTPSAPELFAGPGVASVNGVTVDPQDATPEPASTTWTGTVEVDSTSISTGAGAVNQILVGANAQAAGADVSSDAEDFSIYGQTISGITATPVQANIPGGTTSVVVKVTDQNGNPVAGAHVDAVPSTAPANAGDANGGVGTDGFTNGRGEVVFTGATAGTHNYYVDATNQAGFTNGFDRSAQATITSFTPRATTIDFVSKDGNAFDIDEFENAGGSGDSDITVTVKDQNGNPVANEFFFYTMDYTPFVPAAGTDVAQTFTGQVQTNAQGVAELTIPDNATSNLQNGGTGGTLVLKGYVNRDGSAPGQDPVDLALESQTLKVGESDVEWGGTSTATAQAGSSATFGGSLVLADGTGLAGRTLNVSLANVSGATPDAAFSATQPEGTTRLSATSARVVTDADGEYSVSVTDPSGAGTGPEVSTLTATGTATVGTAPAVKNGVGTDATEDLTINWVLNAAPFKFDTVSATNLLGAATPGRPVRVSFTLRNAQNDPLAGQTVTLKVDHGFFTTDAASASGLEPAAAPAEGGLYGAWKNLGDTVTVTTNSSGVATATVAIEKDAGFDDNGAVRTVVTATAGAANSTDPNSSPIQIDWTSANPLNSGGLDVAQSEEQTVSVLPKAPTRESVDYDVQAKDQFGNLVINETVAVTTDLGDIVDLTGGPAGVQTGTDDGDAEFALESDDAGEATPTGTWTTEKTVYTDGSLAPGFQATVSTTNQNVNDDGETVEFYETDYAASVYSIIHTGADTQPTGTTVTMTYKAVDQNGEPLTGYDVVFFRTGPDDLQDGDGNSISTTNADGEATYVFQGAKAGKAVVTAVLHEPDGGAAGANGDLIPQGEVTDSVQFKAAEKENINLKAAGKNNGKKADKLKVTAKDNAAGLVAKVFVGGKKVAQHTLNSSGDWNFTIKDKNGKKATKYVVKVSDTELTKADQASKKLK